MKTIPKVPFNMKNAAQILSYGVSLWYILVCFLTGCLRIEIRSGVLKEAMKRRNKLLAMSRGLERCDTVKSVPTAIRIGKKIERKIKRR